MLVATSGDSLGAPDVVVAMQRELMPLADLITPNVPEAARLTGMPEPRDAAEMLAVAEVLHQQGARAILVKGGHLQGETAQDLLFVDGNHRIFSAPRIDTRNTHGTGCTLSSAIAANIAHGMSLEDAVAAAKTFLTGALQGSGALDVGRGHGPVNHFWKFWPSD